jgi:hypothetical protein
MIQVLTSAAKVMSELQEDLVFDVEAVPKGKRSNIPIRDQYDIQCRDSFVASAEI